MTRIDRYLLTIYLRTLIICFCSLAGIFVVFHAFNNMEEISSYARREGASSAPLFATTVRSC
ncbi:MAG: hypothetical protein R3C05_18300 [Pirellulaceae bacterium]